MIRPHYHHRCFQVKRKYFIKRRKKLQEKKIIKEVVSHMGIGRVFDRKRDIRVRIAWLGITLFCTIGCLNHIALRISAFIDNPVAIDLRLEHRSQIFFPSVTVCTGILSRMLKSDLHLWQLQKACIADKSRCFGNILEDYDHLSTPLSQEQLRGIFVYQAGIHPLDVKIEESCSSKKSVKNKNCQKTLYPIHLSPLMTMWGMCAIISFPKPMPYRGSFTGFTIKLNTTEVLKYNPREQEYYFFLHRRGLRSRHDAPYLAQAVKVGYETSVRIFIQEYEFQNTWRKPCTSEEETVQCLNDCMDKIMEINLTCSLPFVRSNKLKECKTVVDLLTTYQAAYEVYSTVKISDCQCKQKCNKITYTRSTTEQKLEYYNQTNIVLTFPQNSYETLVENSVFSKSALISEIGGTLGLYLGLNMMKLFDGIELFFHYLAFIK